MVSWKTRRIRQILKDGDLLRTNERQMTGYMVKNGGQESSCGEKRDLGDAQFVGEVVGPAEEEIGDDGDGGIRVGVEPVGNWVLELSE